jgi:hypothetical protein
MSILFITLAAICNAVMDKSMFHFHKSIFPKVVWWDGVNSWRNKYRMGNDRYGRRKILNTNINYPVQLTDAFHFFKMLSIVFICLSIVTYSTVFNTLLDVILYGTIWNVTFSLFFDRILVKK